MSLAVSYTTHTVEITASGLAVAAIGNTVEVSCVNRSIQVSPMAFQVSVAQAGAQGPAGPGVPVGGTTGQVLKKLSNANLDTGWGDVGNGDMLKSVYDTDNDGKVDAAEAADSVPWSGITSKPSTYSPSAHKSTHASGGSDALTPSDIGAATSTHNHDSAYAAIGHTHSGVYAPVSHTHAIADVTNLQTALDGKASTTHNHDSAYAAIGHNHDSAYAPVSHNHDTTYLSKTNTSAYTPTQSYHPATKKYVDDLVSSSGGGDMLKSVYDTDNDGKVDVAETAQSVPWSGVTDKPSTYTPSGHKTSHASGGTDALSPADIGAATASHNHDGVYATAGHDHSGVYAPATHSHNDLYYTETEINALFNTSTGHDHDGTDSAKIPESSLSLSDTTTGDVSTSAHGFVPKAPGDTGKFLRGDGTWAAVTVGVVGHSGFDATEYSHTGNTYYTLKKTFTFTPTAASFGTFVFSLQMKTSTSAGTGNVLVAVDDVSVFTANLANTAYTTKPSTAVVALPMTAAEHTVKVYLHVTNGTQTVYVRNIYFAYIGVKTA